MDNILEVIMARLDQMDRGQLETLNRLLDLIELRQSDPESSPVPEVEEP